VKATDNLRRHAARDTNIRLGYRLSGLAACNRGVRVGGPGNASIQDCAVLAGTVQEEKAPTSADNGHRAIEGRLADIADLQRPKAFPGTGERQESASCLYSCPAGEGGAARSGLLANNAVASKIYFITRNGSEALG